MTREWKPGDVGLFRVDRWSSAIEWPDDTSQVLMQFDGTYWSAVEGDPSAPLAIPLHCQHNMHPLVTIDPEDRESVERLTAAYMKSVEADDFPSCWQDMQAALREFADPTPKLEEPTGLGAVVEDAGGIELVRAPVGSRDPVPWVNTITGQCLSYAGINVVRVLSEGVTS